MDQKPSNCMNVEERSKRRKGYRIFSYILRGSNIINISFRIYVEYKKVLFNFRFLKYNYAKIQANLLTFYAQNACLKEPYFGGIQSR